MAHVYFEESIRNDCFMADLKLDVDPNYVRVLSAISSVRYCIYMLYVYVHVLCTT